MGCSLPLCYGRSCCSSCGGSIALIKEGQRKRLTFFCGSCQVPDANVEAFLRRRRPTHRITLPLLLPKCRCGLLPQVQLFRRPGKDFNRLHAICAKRKHVYQPGCAGQHRRELHNPKSSCNHFTWLDIGNSALIANSLPKCLCRQAPIFRRAMSLRDNSQVFARCQSRTCCWRMWLAPRELGRNPLGTDSELPRTNVGDDMKSQGPDHITRQQKDFSCSRWSRHTLVSMPVKDLLLDDQPDHAPPPSSRPLTSKNQAARRGQQPWRACELEISRDNTEESDEPLTSGEEDADEEDVQSARAHLQLLSLEESWARLRDARPEDAPPAFQKRWRRAAER